MSPTRTEPLSNDAILPATATLRRAAELVGRAQLPVLLIGDPASPRSLSEAAVRAAWQDRRDPDLPLGDLAQSEGIAATLADAEAWLAAEPSRAAALLIDAGPPRVVCRDPAPVTTAILMAGGIGSRLRPLTDDTPKPLLEVGGVPLLDRIVQLLAAHGVDRVFVSVNYLGDKVKEHLGDGSRLGVTVEYLDEDEPLDTGAGLALIPRIDAPFFVINGDVLTNANLTSMARAHVLGGAIATVATFLYPMPLPYGYVHYDGLRLREIEEKPMLQYAVNAGIYVIAPEALDHVTRGAPLAMVPFLNDRVAAGQRVERFPLVEYWNDVGQPHDYMRAQKDVRSL